jgi:uncharacterized protein YacL
VAVSPAPATQSVVPYQTPNARAIQTAGHAAIGFGASVGIVIIPILVKFLTSGDFSQTALTTLISVIGAAILGVLLTYCVKYVQATGSDVPPTVPPAPPVA